MMGTRGCPLRLRGDTRPNHSVPRLWSRGASTRKRTSARISVVSSMDRGGAERTARKPRIGQIAGDPPVRGRKGKPQSGRRTPLRPPRTRTFGPLADHPAVSIRPRPLLPSAILAPRAPRVLHPRRGSYARAPNPDAAKSGSVYPQRERPYAREDAKGTVGEKGVRESTRAQ